MANLNDKKAKLLIQALTHPNLAPMLQQKQVEEAKENLRELFLETSDEVGLQIKDILKRLN